MPPIDTVGVRHENAEPDAAAAKLQTTLDHLKHAQELGSKLSDYAEAFGLKVKDLYNGRTQLQRKGLWPKSWAAPLHPPKLLAVQVTEPASAGMDGWMYLCDIGAAFRNTGGNQPWVWLE